MMKLLHVAGYFPDIEGWESEFPRMAAEVFPEVTEEELRRQQDIIMRKVYGETLPKEEEA